MDIVKLFSNRYTPFTIFSDSHETCHTCTQICIKLIGDFFLILNLDSLRNSSGGAIWAHTPLCYELTCGKHFVDITNVADFSRLSLYNSQLMLCRILPVELFDYWVPFLEKIQEFGKIAVLRNM